MTSIDGEDGNIFVGPIGDSFGVLESVADPNGETAVVKGFGYGRALGAIGTFVSELSEPGPLTTRDVVQGTTTLGFGGIVGGLSGFAIGRGASAVGSTSVAAGDRTG